MKYIGSKQRLSKQIVPIIRHAIETSGSELYIEPFVGGANVIDKVDAVNKIGSDNNPYLIALLNAAKRGERIPDTVTRRDYDAVKREPHRYPFWYVGLVGFCASYNAKFFGGYANGVPTKAGTVRNYTDEAIRNLKKQAPSLSDVCFMVCDYKQWSDVGGAVIYCDPPYAGVTAYDKKPFDTTAFFGWCRLVGQDNIVLVSEYEAPRDFFEIANFSLSTTLDKSRKIQRTERVFTVGLGAKIFGAKS